MRWLVAILSRCSPETQSRPRCRTSTGREADLPGACFKCHGPDDAARKAKLRLDSRNDAEHVLKASGSELVRRILSMDADEVMPPPSAKVKLTEKEKETLKSWVAAGAKYNQHWAFIPPEKQPIPKTKRQLSNPIDSFVLSRLEKEGLGFSAEADRHTLIRRVYLDLIGVPPTPVEVDAFLADKSPQAWEKLVDKLLGSPLYGERWARKWLDLARYADTNGYEKDRQRSIWPYRDWVIKALNDDMPFDRFTIEQLAGDMLPGATTSQRVATGFHRNTMLNEEGGIDPLEFRYHAMTDRVATTGTVWLGLTIGCAQCHTHKFDPITHTDYFRFFAFLNNAEEPELSVLSEEIDTEHRAAEKKLQNLTQIRAKKAASSEMLKAFASWQAEQSKSAVAWTVIRPTRMEGGLTKLALLPDGSIFASGDTISATSTD